MRKGLLIALLLLPVVAHAGSVTIVRQTPAIASAPSGDPVRQTKTCVDFKKLVADSHDVDDFGRNALRIFAYSDCSCNSYKDTQAAYQSSMQYVRDIKGIYAMEVRRKLDWLKTNQNNPAAPYKTIQFYKDPKYGSADIVHEYYTKLYFNGTCH